MRWVIDKNCFAKKELREFLAGSRENQALLPVYAAMECYAGDPAKNIVKSTSVLLQFPDQVFVLKDPDAIMRMGPIDTKAPLALVDDVQTLQFRQLPALLAAIARGDRAARKFVEQQGREAEIIRREALQQVPDWRPLFDAPFKYPQALATARSGGDIEAKHCYRMMEFGIDELAHALRAGDKSFPPLPLFVTPASYYYKYRWATALWWLAFHWAMRRGGVASGMNQNELRNDFFDIGYVVAATYFDDVMSDDDKVKWNYAMTRDTIRALAERLRERRPPNANEGAEH